MRSELFFQLIQVKIVSSFVHESLLLFVKFSIDGQRIYSLQLFVKRLNLFF